MQNGLINPIVIDDKNNLLAGERRLMACRALGWKQVPVRIITPKDAEHALNIEISENEMRQDFSMTERLDYARRLQRIERVKAQERMVKAHTEGVQNSAQLGKTRDKVSDAVGMSHDTLRKAQQIEEYRDMVPPEDFADWDDGKLSTNKVYTQLKEKLAAAEKRAEDAENLAENTREDAETLARKNKELTEQINQKPKEVIKEVVPDDYKKAKRDAAAYKQDFENERTKAGKNMARIHELEQQIEELKQQTAKEQANSDVVASSIFFAAECRDFLDRVGGYVWVIDKLMDLPESERKGFIVSVGAIRDWASVLLDNIERRTSYGRDDIERIICGADDKADG